MNLKHKLGQMFNVGLEGPTLLEKEAKLIVENNIGGVTLFSRNISNLEQVKQLCESLQALTRNMPSQQNLLIAIDQEGGRVARIKEPLTLFPPMFEVGKENSAALCFDVATQLAQDLLGLGINWDFAPVLDVRLNPENEVIGDRAFSEDPDQVAKLTSGFLRGFRKAGMISCGKHFPGHGYTSLDSHFDLPVDDRTLEELKQTELIPFRKAIAQNVDTMMMAHIIYPKVDPKWPASLSKIWIQEILRDELGYKGLIVSDDINMKALDSYRDQSLSCKAIEAGADVMLYCEGFEAQTAAIKEAQTQAEEVSLNIENAFDRIIKLKDKFLS